MHQFRIGIVALLIAFAKCDLLNEKAVEAELSSYLQKIENSPQINIVGDYIVLQKSEQSELDEGVSRGNEDLFERCGRFLASRELKIKFPESEARELLKGARSKKLRKFILPILLLLKLKAAIVLPIILSIIALVSFKGFGMGLAALAVSGTTALKNLLEHVGSKVSYEVVPAPIGHWSRSGVVTDNSVAAVYQYE